MGLSDKVSDPTIRQSIVTDCTHLIDRQVASKSGLSGMALKATYGVVKGVGAGYIPSALERLLPDVCAALDPMWAEGEAKGDPVGHLNQHSEQAADAVLSVTDTRIQGTSNGVVKSSYKKLRKSVKSDVEAAVPELAEIIGRYV